MIFKLTDHFSIANKFIAEMRDVKVQKDSLRFRRNMERLGEILAVEISKTLEYEKKEVETPLGIAEVDLPSDRIVLATILRAGLPMHQGFLNIFDDAGNAFVSAYRKHHKDGTFEINLEYLSSPDLTDCTLILCDPMLATGASITKTIPFLLENGTPKKIHIATIIASADGVERVQRLYPQASLWIGAIDDELTAKSYIVPGLGDAGDLAFGVKIQD